MELVELTRSLIEPLLKDKESLNVKEFETDEENTILIEVMIAEDDMGRIIGKGGKTANAIRTLVQASSYLKENKRIKINIDHF